MAIVEKHNAGSPAWVELCTSNLAGARAFYEKLFGWTSFEMPTHGAGAFVMLRRNGIEVAAAYTIASMQADKGISPHWLIYFATEDVDATAERVKQARGAVVFGPFDVGDAGRSCIFADPHGAMFGCWQAKSHLGSGIVHEPGTLCWPELATPIAAESKAFYRNVFGWKTKENPVGAAATPVIYTEWMLDGEPLGGCLQMTDEWKGIPPHWMPYFQVEDCQAACDQIRELGGKVKFGPLPIANVGDFAVVFDPQGVVFSVIELYPIVPSSE